MSQADQCPSTSKPGEKHRPARELLAKVRRPLSRVVNGGVAWRSAEELSDAPEFRDFVEREFPAGASELLASSRRGFLQVMGASLALAGLATVPGCRRPDHKILAYSSDVPEHIIPGQPLFYATSYPLPGGGAEGLLAECHEGRPTKLEGNPLHPANQGKSSVTAQASILGLYDPDRLKFPTLRAGEERKERSWDDFRDWAIKGDGEHEGHFRKFEKSKGAGLALMIDKKSSPTRDTVIAEFRKRYPEAVVVNHYPMDARGQAEGTAWSFGGPMREVLSLGKARVIVSLDRDFLRDDPGALVNAREFAATRIPTPTGRKTRVEALGEEVDEYEMSRVYAVESGWTLTGGQADHRLRLAPSNIIAFAVELARYVLPRTALKNSAALVDALTAIGGDGPKAFDSTFLHECATDLLANGKAGRGVVLAGRHMPAEVHAICHAINAGLESLGKGKLVAYHPMPESQAADSAAELAVLVDRMKAGKVDTLVCIDCNPCYDAPGDSNFAELYKKVPTTVCMSVASTETAALSTWSLNGCHPLECWGDTESNDGTIAIVQPMIAPLFGPILTDEEKKLPEEDRPAGALSELELISMVLGEPIPSAHEMVRKAWWARLGSTGVAPPGFADTWKRALHDGVVPNQAAPAWHNGSVNTAAVAAKLAGFKVPAGPTADSFDVVFVTGHVHDGRFANASWLQELPDFATMVCWDNPALMSPATAVRLGLWAKSGNRYTEDKFPQSIMADFTLDGRTVKLPVWIMPGMADDTVIMKVGYGRTNCGLVGDGVGFNVFPFRGGTTGLMARGCKVAKTTGDFWICSTQNHWSLESRTSIVRAVDLPVFAKFAKEIDPHKDETYGLEAKLKLGERLGELSHTPPNVGIYKNPYNSSAGDAAAGSAYSKGPQWGMTIDLSSCIGCSTCTIACQAENNIPVVGKKETSKGREMTWIRVDRYFASFAYGDDKDMKSRPGGTGEGSDIVAALNDPEEMLHQPIACVHCENAPCETVCPVNATIHTEDGLNSMAYNRCIGTRYCANNCPYKVRRFNFFDYGVTKFNGLYHGRRFVEQAAPVLPLEKSGVNGSTAHNTINPNLIPPRLREKLDQITRMSKNPDVTVRSRGVMEKCSYCVQRINSARIAWNSRRDLDPKLRNQVPDGFFQTACQQACPTSSITFGDTLDTRNKYLNADGTERTGSRVAATRDDPRSYALLGYLNTRPRTSHMIKVRNPNENLVADARKKSWKEPFHHGGGHHGAEGHEESPGTTHGGKAMGSSPAVIHANKKAEDKGYAMSLTVLGAGAQA